MHVMQAARFGLSGWSTGMPEQATHSTPRARPCKGHKCVGTACGLAGGGGTGGCTAKAHACGWPDNKASHASTAVAGGAGLACPVGVTKKLEILKNSGFVLVLVSPAAMRRGCIRSGRAASCMAASASSRQPSPVIMRQRRPSSHAAGAAARQAYIRTDGMSPSRGHQWPHINMLLRPGHHDAEIRAHSGGSRKVAAVPGEAFRPPNSRQEWTMAGQHACVHLHRQLGVHL